MLAWIMLVWDSSLVAVVLLYIYVRANIQQLFVLQYMFLAVWMVYVT
jgi:hypothetical protein